MAKMDDIKMATLRLDGEANDWWFHGMKTLGHDIMTSYEEFTKRLMDRFERKDPEIPFRELSFLRQTITPEEYILEFQWIARRKCMVVQWHEDLGT